MTRTISKRSQTLLALAAITALVATSGTARAQQHNHSHEGDSHAGHDHASHGDHDHSGEVLAFHLPAWKSMHFDVANKAAQHAATVKKLGCEVKQDNHAGHIDVTYRSANWRSMQVKNHQLADQWSKWLAASGFDVSHGHSDPAYTKGSEAVEFRLVNWKELHGDGSPNEAAFIDQMRRIGCDVRVNKHDGHSDIKFRAPTWRDVHLASHDDADRLMGWLKQYGFEVRHEH